MKLYKTYYRSLKRVLMLFSFLFSSFSFSQDQTKDLLKISDSLLKIDVNKSILMAKKVFLDKNTTDGDYIKASILLKQAFLIEKEIDSALVYTNKALDRAINAKDTVNIIALYKARGLHYFKSNNNKQALEDVVKAKIFYDSFSGIKNQDLNLLYAKILNNIAAVYIRKTQLDSSIVYLSKAINIKEANNAPKRSIATTKHNLGSVYSYLKDYQKSIELNLESIKDAKESQDSILLASCYMDLASAYKFLKNYEKAIENYKITLDYSEPLNYSYLKGMSYQNIGALYRVQKKYKLAKNYYLKACKVYNKDQNEIAGVYLGLANVYSVEKNYDSAIYYNQKAASVANRLHTLTEESNAYEQLSKNYKELGQYQTSLTNLERFIVLNDSIMNIEKQKNIQTLKTEFETEQKQKEIIYLKELNKSENEKSQAIQSRQRMIIFSVISILALVLISFYLYRSKRKKEKKLVAMQLANEKLKNKEFQTDIEYKTKQLATHAINMLQKNLVLTDVKEQITSISIKADSKYNKELKSVIRDISINQKNDKDWDLFRKYFEDVNQDFYNKLKKINPDLTTHDYRLAALVSLNINIKEAASLLNISPNSVKIARHRLRKRLHVKTGEDLYSFITNL